MIKSDMKNYILLKHFNRAAAKISALSSGKIDKYEYLADEKILTPQKHRTIQPTKFSFSPLGKAFEKQRNPLKSRGKRS